MAVDVAVDAFLDELSEETGLVTWHSRIRSSLRPGAAINVSFDFDVNAIYKENMNIRVSQQPLLFVNRGQIPVVICRTRGIILTTATVGEVLIGDYRGTCSIRYDIKIEDHLVDVNGNEYVVMVANDVVTRKFKALTLKWLPR